MNWLKFINKIKPDGKAFASIRFTLILFEVMADALKMLVDYADLEINDQVWFVNDNFDPEPWEERYGITPPFGSTIEERRIVVKSFMLYPQSGNRLSLDYMQSVLDDKGYSDAILSYNSLGTDSGFLHVNDFGDEKITFNLGPLTYNTFRVTGDVTAVYYQDIIFTLMGLKPLQVGFYDELNVFSAVAYDETLALAVDDNNTLAITTL
jgi:hypothetical protein